MILNKRMGTTIKYLSELKKGQKGIIDSFTDYELSLKLLEMGCIPGEIIEVIRIAPLAIFINNYPQKMALLHIAKN